MKKAKILYWILVTTCMCTISVQIQGKMSSYMQERCTHLKEYTYFKSYNQNHFFNQFKLSEVWSNGVPYYRLFAPEERIEVRVNKEQTMASVYYLGKSVSFKIGGFISTKANLYLSDLTGDNFPELIYEEPISGADSSVGNCVVIELRTMKQLIAQDKTNKLLKNIKVEQVRQDGDKITCKVIDSNHHIYFGQAKGNCLGNSTDVIDSGGNLTVEYDASVQKLKAYTCFTLPGCKDNSFLGDICAYYAYDVMTQKFELESDYIVTLWEPLNE